MIWQFLINGFITGILYSLLAVGFALVYNTTCTRIAVCLTCFFIAIASCLTVYDMGLASKDINSAYVS